MQANVSTGSILPRDDSAAVVGTPALMPPGAELLIGAVDPHVHACPHLNRRSVDVFEAVEQAAAAGMRGIGLMDNFAVSVGYAALARRRLSHLDVDVFGGVILEPQVGGISADVVTAALGVGYADGDGARFVSMPTHHTRAIARLEGRSAAYVEACLEIPEHGPLPDPLPAILDLVAAHDVVLNTGHLTAAETFRLVEVAWTHGIRRVLCPSNTFSAAEIAQLASAGAWCEFSFFFLTHATQLGLTHVDAEPHRAPSVTLDAVLAGITAATPARTILSSDCGVSVLPPPVEGLREFLQLLRLAGVADADLRTMAGANPAELYRVRAPDA